MVVDTTRNVLSSAIERKISEQLEHNGQLRLIATPNSILILILDLDDFLCS